MDVALGNAFAGVFTNSDLLWQRLESAGKMTSDPFWRMPLHDAYLKEMKESTVADLNNLGKGRSGGACSAAAFLKEFVAGVESEQPLAWAHIDIAGVMDSDATQGYHIKGMSGKLILLVISSERGMQGLSTMHIIIIGRPTRSLVEYMRRVSA